jgi:peptide/nickel transport system substrate-binding protein
MRHLIVACTAALLAAAGSPALAAPEGKVVIAQGVDATALDPNWHVETPTGNICRQFYETLFDRDHNLKIIPRLATGWERRNDTTWRISLRKGVKFHNGEPFDAQAVKFSLELIKKPEYASRQAPFFTALDHVEIVDPYTVDVITNKPYPVMIELLAWLGAMLPPKLAAEKGIDWLKTNAVGTGAYQFVRWTKGEEVVGEANPDYWGGAPAIQTMVFRPIPENTTRVAALQTGEVDMAVNIPPHMVPIVQQDAKLRIGRVPSARFITVFLDTRYNDSPLKNVKVRQAINYAVNVDGIVASVMEGQGQRIAGLLTDMHFGYDAGVKPYPTNRNRAKELLAEAGYPGGLAIAFDAPDGRYVNDKQVAEAIAGELAKVGIRVQLNIQEWGNYIGKIVTHKASPMWMVGWGNAMFDADNTYTPLVHSSALLSVTNDPELDKLIDAARATFDAKQRQSLYTQVAQRLRDQANFLFLYQQMDLYGINKRLVWEPRSDEQILVSSMKLK